MLRNRNNKAKRAAAALDAGDCISANRLLAEIVYGCSAGRDTDPGMAGSLLYHMAMITKMAAEARYLLKDLAMEKPSVDEQLWRFYNDFASDVAELAKPIVAVDVNSKDPLTKSLETKEKLTIFLNLSRKTKKILEKLEKGIAVPSKIVESLFQEWARSVVRMRLRQEFETIQSLLITSELVRICGVPALKQAMERVQDRFGEETVNIALEVTLKVGLRREKLQTIMLSDHLIDYKMNVANLDGNMVFHNCPIAGSHRYISERTRLNDTIASLFCKHFCYAHAKAMLETVLPFAFTLSQPQQIATHGKCEFYMKLANSPEAKVNYPFVPLVISWNVTRKCNLKCSHCYINATEEDFIEELTTEEAMHLMDQLSEVSRPLLILSGGEPLLRKDIYELIAYGASKGFRMGLGSNGGLITWNVAKKLKAAGLNTASISLDSNIPEKHDEFRGLPNSWKKAVRAIKALKRNGILVQVNTTVTKQNCSEIDDIMSLAENLGVENFHLFFLVPTGRGSKITDISPTMYEEMIKTTFAKTGKHQLNVKPSCAPQFMRIAKDNGLDMRQWIRGCIAGLYYCRVFPNGDITPCPYLPIKLGNIREKTFSEIWLKSSVFTDLRDINKLRGKCGTCKHRYLCGGCRARAYGLSSDFIDYCGDLHEPGELRGDYLAEDPWCVYRPNEPSKS